MNLADYLSELMGQYDEVSVPGLGYFVREHISAYYSESEARFYPPSHRVKFVPELRDDDDLFAQYVADKKNISLASSKYFAEKFVSKLKEDAVKSKYQFSDLGSFRVEHSQLVFSPNEKIAADPSYFGYPPVSIFKQGQPVFTDKAPSLASPTSSSATSIKQAYAPPASVTPVVTTPQPVHTVLSQQYFEEDTERKRPVNIWVIIIIIVVALALAVFGVFKFYPATFNNISGQFRQLTGIGQAEVDSARVRKARADSLKKMKAYLAPEKLASMPDSVSTTKKTNWIIIESEYKTIPEAKKALAYLGRHAVPAEIHTDMLGPLVKVTVGTYPTFSKADSARTVLVAAGKISKKSHIDPINP